jgi:SAM-dependent methyltransferase
VRSPVMPERPNMDRSELAARFRQDPEGIWIAPSQSPISYPEEGNETYFQIEDGSFWFRHRNRCLLEAMKRYPPSGTLFDIGGGNGFVSMAAQNVGYPVVLVEPGRRGAVNARRRGVQDVICATLEDANLPSGVMGAAGAFDVVEHIADDAGFLRGIAQSLAPRGRFYVTVPAYSLLWSQEDHDAGHYRRYTATGVRKLIESAGFEIEYCTYLFTFLPLPILALRTAPYRLGWRRPPSAIKSRVSSEHQPASGMLQWLLDSMLDREVTAIRDGRVLPFGGSCLAVARKLE